LAINAGERPVAAALPDIVRSVPIFLNFDLCAFATLRLCGKPLRSRQSLQKNKRLSRKNARELPDALPAFKNDDAASLDDALVICCELDPVATAPGSDLMVKSQ
jgi:hypothetical protein